MSRLIVEISRINQIVPHPNADRLELAQIKGWQCVVLKGKYAAGDLVTYVPLDSVVPDALAERLGVVNYLSKGRVRCAKLRGEPSFGMIFDRKDVSLAEGTDVAARYGITKFVPPMKISAGDAASPHALFVSYTSLENMRNFNTVFEPGEEVVATEKIHGTSCRVGICLDGDEMVAMAGSKDVRRRRPADEKIASDIYWHPWSLAGIQTLMAELQARSVKQAILYGEVYGKIQSLRYGNPNGIAFRAFDLLIDGHYVDHDAFAEDCDRLGVERVPLIYRGPFELATIKEISDGRSTVPGADNIREGVVVRPTRERSDPDIGRVILKYVGDTYLLKGDISDTHDV